MKKALMGIIALMVLGGGAGGAYYFFKQPAEAAITEEGDHAPKEAKADKKEGGGHGEKPQMAFVKMDPLILPIMDENGVSQIISLVVALEVKDEETAKEVQFMAPKIKDAYLQDMYGVLNRKAALEGGAVQVGMIKKRLNMITNKVLGEDKVSDVLLQVVQQRPI